MILNPFTTYSGLTIVLDKPSRFDVEGLLSGHAGSFFDDCLLTDLKHNIYRSNCQVRTLDECQRTAFLPNTRVLLLLGEASLKQFNSNVTLGEQRGSPFMFCDIVCVATFTPQDAFDRKAFYEEDNDESEEGEDDSDGKSTHGKTRRKNWKFWMRQDIRKAVRLTREGLYLATPDIRLYPDAEEVVRLLSTMVGEDFYFDIETDAQLQLTCFGFSFGQSGIVYVVPMVQTYLTPRKYYYDETTNARIFRALGLAMHNNVCVIHNSMFDLFVICWRYRIPLGLHIFDTMLAHARNYIEVEKSLGHVISLYTDLPYHKNEGVFEPHNSQQTDMLYRYNGKDVFAMTQLKPAILARAAQLGATESVEQVNRMIIPYLMATLQGMSVDWTVVDKIAGNNLRRQTQIKRILSILTGKVEFNPNSPKQVATYLYDELGNKRPDKDLTNEKNLLQLQLKGEIHAITAILEYRKLSKQTSKVSFEPYTGLYGECKRLFTTLYKLAGTTTMRLSACALKLGFDKSNKQGDNAQNFEKGLRKIIIPTDYEDGNNTNNI